MLFQTDECRDTGFSAPWVVQPRNKRTQSSPSPWCQVLHLTLNYWVTSCISWDGGRPSIKIFVLGLLSLHFLEKKRPKCWLFCPKNYFLINILRPLWIFSKLQRIFHKHFNPFFLKYEQTLFYICLFLFQIIFFLCFPIFQFISVTLPRRWATLEPGPQRNQNFRLG
jgi:hypothetical protein